MGEISSFQMTNDISTFSLRKEYFYLVSQWRYLNRGCSKGFYETVCVLAS